jgi:ketosteroid isomerase-like protein
MSAKLTQGFARRFADDWIQAWNSHDIERVLSHYAPDVELISPLMGRVLGQGKTTVRGVPALREYFSRALAAYPELQFVPRHVYAGARSVVVQYESVGGRMSAEVLEFNDAGKVIRVLAHYSAEAEPV